MIGNIFLQNQKGTKYSRNCMIDSLVKFNARKGICGQFFFLKHNKYVSLFSFRHYLELVAAEIVLEAYVVP